MEKISKNKFRIDGKLLVMGQNGPQNRIQHSKTLGIWYIATFLAKK
jgi:hypothetical protein